MSLTGRNDPCPCGSGKKYKKCCMAADEARTQDRECEDDDFLPPDAPTDCGQPLTNKDFFDGNPIHEISAARLMYSTLLYPKMEKLANIKARQIIDRGKAELQRIESAWEVESLIGIMKNGPEMINHGPLIERLVEHKERCVPMILNELTEPTDSAFIELAIKTLHRSGMDCSKELINLIKSGHNRKAYPISTLCILLGFFDNEQSEKLLWDYYHYFKNNYPGETYADGPLLGLIEIRERRKERSSVASVQSAP